MSGWRGFLGCILDPFSTTVFRPRGCNGRASAQRRHLSDDRLPSVDHMIWELDEVLERARLGGQEAETEPIDVRVLLAQIIARYDADRVHLASVRWPVLVLAKPPAIARVFEILIETSLGNGTTTTVRLDRGVSEMVAYVDDNGPGVPRAARETMLAGTSSDGDRNSALATARTLARAMQGDVTISSSPEGGSRVAVRLPIVPDGALEYAAAS